MSYKIVVQNGDGCAPPLDHYSPATAQAVALSARSGRRCSIHGAKFALQHLSYFPKSDWFVVSVRDTDLDTGSFDPYRCEPLVIAARSRRDHPLAHRGDGAGALPLAVAVP